MLIHYLWFSWLLNMGVWDFQKPVTELSASKNIQEDEVSVLKRVPWYSKAASDQVNTWTNNVNFLAHYFQNSTGNRYLIGGSNSSTAYNLEYRTTSTWTALTGGSYALRANAELSAVNYLDKLFIVWYDATDSEYLLPATITGTVHTTSTWTDTNLTDMPSGKYIVEYNDLIYVLNAYISSNKYPSSAYYCDTPVDWSITWDNTVNFLEFWQQDWDEITWAANSWNRLVVFKSNSMWTWDESNKKKIASIGCDSYKSIKQVNWILYWFNRNGLWRWDWALPQLISGKVQPFIDAIDQSALSSVVSTVNGLEYRTFIWTVTVRWITYTNCWIVFDARREKFYIRCTISNALSATEYVESWKKRSYFGSNTWYAYKFSTYIDWVNSDDWNDIDYFFMTNALDMWNPHIEKYLGKTTFYTLNWNWLKYVIDADKSWEFKEWVSGQINESNIYNNDLWASWHRFTFKFFNKDSGTPMEFEWFSLESNEKEST